MFTFLTDIHNIYRTKQQSTADLAVGFRD